MTAPDFDRCSCGLHVAYAAPEQHDPRCPVAAAWRALAATWVDDPEDLIDDRFGPRPATECAS